MSTKPVMKMTEPPASETVRSMLSAHIVTVPLDTFTPRSVRVSGPVSGEIPTSIDELTNGLSYTYDLSVTAALQLNIPIIGSVSGGIARRVVVAERCAFKPITQDGIERRYGYAIRMCVTVDKMECGPEGQPAFPQRVGPTGGD